MSGLYGIQNIVLDNLTRQIKTHGDREITRRLELSILVAEHETAYSQDAIDTIVHMTCSVNQNLIMGHAVEIYDAGFHNEYINDPDKRTLIDIWCKTHYGELSLREFLDCVAAPSNRLSEVS